MNFIKNIKVFFLDIFNWIYIIPLIVAIIYYLVSFFLGSTDLGWFFNRVINLFYFWISVFIFFFLPRRVLIKNKFSRYFTLYLKRKYPKLIYYRLCFNFFEVIQLSMYFIIFYLERALKYLIIGTKVRWLKPYRKTWESYEWVIFFVKLLLLEFNWIILIILKAFYNILRFFDNASLFTIFKYRVFGILWVTSMVFLFGVNFIFYYFLILFFGVYFVLFLDIFDVFKILKEEEPFKDNMYLFKEALINRINKVGISIMIQENDIIKIRNLVVIFFSHIKIKTYLYLRRILFIYGEDEMNKYINFSLLLPVIVDKITKKPFLKQNKFQINNSEFIWKYKFITKFERKKAWYLKKSSEDGFDFLIRELNVYENFFFFKIHTIDLIVRNKFDEILLNDIYILYILYGKEYFEFKEVFFFIVKLRALIQDNGGNEIIYEKYFFEYYDILNVLLIKKQNNIISLEEYLKLIGEIYVNIFRIKFNCKI